MADDWENVVIETGVDTLLNYLAENQEEKVSQISEDLGVSEDRIKEWAQALEENGFVEKKYSARKGVILKYTPENKQVAEEKMQKLRKHIEQESEKVENELESRSKEIEKAKKQLKQMAEELEENREEEEEVKSKLQELEELEEELEDRLREQKKKEERLHSKSVDLLAKIDSKLNRIEEAQEKAGEFEEKKDEIKKKLKALKKLENHIEKASDIEKKLEEIESEESETESLAKTFWERFSGIFSSSSGYSGLLEGNVDEVKDKVSELDSPDYEAIIDAEKKGENRTTLIEWLEEKK